MFFFQARTTTNNYQSFNYEPATESEFNRQPVFKPEYIQPQPNFAQDRGILVVKLLFYHYFQLLYPTYEASNKA